MGTPSQDNNPHEIKVRTSPSNERLGNLEIYTDGRPKTDATEAGRTTVRAVRLVGEIRRTVGSAGRHDGPTAISERIVAFAQMSAPRCFERI